MWFLVLAVLIASVATWAVTTLAPMADLTLLPRHRRQRVEWCRLHHSQVQAACGTLLAGLVLAQVVSTL